MAQPLRDIDQGVHTGARTDVDPGADPGADVPFVDHDAVRETVRLHRARRKARIEHRKRTRRAGIRFWLVLLLLLGASLVLLVTVWNEIQRLFGL